MFESDKPKKVAIDTRLKKWALKPRKPLISQGFSGGLRFRGPKMEPHTLIEPPTFFEILLEPALKPEGRQNPPPIVKMILLLAAHP